MRFGILLRTSPSTTIRVCWIPYLPDAERAGLSTGTCGINHSSGNHSITSPETPKHRTGPHSPWSTLAVHAGEDQEPKPRGAVADPIFCASTYAFSDTQALLDFIVQKQPREEYARYGNPTGKTIERKLAVLEGAEAAVLYADPRVLRA